MFTYEKHPNDNGSTMRFELRDDGDINVDEVAASTMWSILLPILLEFEELLQAYSGNVFIIRVFSKMDKKLPLSSYNIMKSISGLVVSAVGPIVPRILL